MNNYNLAHPNRILGIICICMVALCFSGRVWAEESDGQLEIGGEDKWQFNVIPYIWFAGIDGDVTVRGLESDVDVDFEDILDVLDFGAIGHFEASKGRWGGFTDLVYLKVSEDGDTPSPAISDIDVEMETLILELAGIYKLRETDSGLFNKPTSFHLLGGIRYTNLDIDIDVTATPLASGQSGSKDWVDPFIGFRSTLQWTPRWSSSLRIDVGGFGVGSDFVYQIITVQRIKINERLEFLIGYRRLTYDYEDGSGAGKFEFDATLSGPVMGLNIKF